MHLPQVDISVVICTRNRASTLAATLQSLSQIQSKYSWEILLVDNASTDNTKEVIAEHGGQLRYLLAERIGLGAARDFAWRRAKGKIVAFTDDDCYPEPDFVDAVVAAFENNPDVSVIGGQIKLYDADDIPVAIDLRTEPVEYGPRAFLDAGLFQGANISFRRCALESIGGFDPDFGAGTRFACEDIDAVAAVLWSGCKGRYDPTPKVHHHHRRRLAQLEGLWKEYDLGRGAYYAKYLLRRDSRFPYLRGWGARIKGHHRQRDVIQFARELRAGAAYLAGRRAWAFLLLATPVAFSAFCAVVFVVMVRTLVKSRGFRTV